jgi:hypothetical protein
VSHFSGLVSALRQPCHPQEQPWPSELRSTHTAPHATPHATLTTPTLCPGWNDVPRCLTSTCPGNASWPSDILVPRYFGREPFLFLVDPPCFLVALHRCG